jgi:hypothetical protein
VHCADSSYYRGELCCDLLACFGLVALVCSISTSVASSRLLSQLGRTLARYCMGFDTL